MLRTHFRPRNDLYVGANMFLYYREGNPNKKLAPDLFVVFGVPNNERRTWRNWEEGKAPDVVVEFTSRSTWDEDLGSKKGLYEWMGVKEYFLFDLETGEPLLPPVELAEALEKSEKRFERETSARQALETELARLKEELARLKGEA